MAIDVLHVGCAYYPYRGGSSVRLSTMIAHQPHVRAHIFTHITEDDGALHGAASIHRVQSYYTRAGRRALRRVVQELRPAAVVLHNPWIMLLWRLAIDPRKRIRCIAEIHNFRDESPWRALVVGWLYRQMDAVVVLSQRAVHLAATRYRLSPNRVFAVRNGAPEFKIKENAGEDCPLSRKVIFGYVGTFYDWQGVGVIAEAVRRLKPWFFERAELVFAGGGPLERSLRDALAEHIARGDVRWRGWISQHEAAELLEQTDVVLMPRLSTLGTEHVTPLKVFEALAYGKAIVASGVGGLTEVLEHGKTAWIVPPGDAISLAHAMEELASGEELLRLLAKNASKAAEKLESWSQVGTAYEALLVQRRAA
jgi:glycosyltransferase involved in cell wall biosynthesis